MKIQMLFILLWVLVVGFNMSCEDIFPDYMNSGTEIEAAWTAGAVNSETGYYELLTLTFINSGYSEKLQVYETEAMETLVEEESFSSLWELDEEYTLTMYDDMELQYDPTTGEVTYSENPCSMSITIAVVEDKLYMDIFRRIQGEGDRFDGTWVSKFIHQCPDSNPIVFSDRMEIEGEAFTSTRSALFIFSNEDNVPYTGTVRTDGDNIYTTDITRAGESIPVDEQEKEHVGFRLNQDVIYNGTEADLEEDSLVFTRSS